VEKRDRTYITIDLKSFYASVECVERGLDPLDANLVVADTSRSEKTICLAVSPSLKKLGIPGRPRLFEVIAKVKEINRNRKKNAPNGVFKGKSCSEKELQGNPSLELGYITATPQMAHYIQKSKEIYETYLSFVSPDDMHVYSIDEVFIDATSYLSLYSLSAEEFARKIIMTVYERTGITATGGIGANLYLAKIAMDIKAKHMAADENGVRIAKLDEFSYRRELWDHRPLSDFWRIGRGLSSRLESLGLYTMGDIAKCSEGADNEYYNEELLYKLFGVNAELIIDHAWGYESTTMEDIKRYKPEKRSIGSGNVLMRPYGNDEALVVLKEMTEDLSLELSQKGLLASGIALHVGYDRSGIDDGFSGGEERDHYGRAVPKHAEGSMRFESASSSMKELSGEMKKLFLRITDKSLPIRRLNITFTDCLPEDSLKDAQLDLFSSEERKAEREKEKRMQSAVNEIRQRFGKNSVLKLMSLQECAVAKERHMQIGGHKA